MEGEYNWSELFLTQVSLQILWYIWDTDMIGGTHKEKRQKVLYTWKWELLDLAMIPLEVHFEECVSCNSLLALKPFNLAYKKLEHSRTGKCLLKTNAHGWKPEMGSAL